VDEFVICCLREKGFRCVWGVLLLLLLLLVVVVESVSWWGTFSGRLQVQQKKWSACGSHLRHRSGLL
jgi:hypothetical protein